eukprot:6648788-Prymnesium_polylepis.1
MAVRARGVSADPPNLVQLLGLGLYSCMNFLGSDTHTHSPVTDHTSQSFSLSRHATPTAQQHRSQRQQQPCVLINKRDQGKTHK